MTGRDAARRHLLEPIFLFGSPSTLLFEANVVRARTPFYAEGPLHSDTETVYEILREHDFAFVHQVLSFTRRQQGSLTSDARALNPLELDRMIVTKRFGPVFLDPDEYDACFAKAQAWFYSGLARQWLRSGLRFSNRDYWERQRRGLGSVGERMRPALLIKGAAGVIADSLLGPLARMRRPRGA
jgi:hypothetical protein